MLYNVRKYLPLFTIKFPQIFHRKLFLDKFRKTTFIYLKKCINFNKLLILRLSKIADFISKFNLNGDATLVCYYIETNEFFQ